MPRAMRRGAVLSIPGAEPDDSIIKAGVERTAAADPPPRRFIADKRGSWGPIGTYWRGEYSLGVSFWVVGFLITALTFSVVFIVTLGISATTSYNPYGLLGIAVFLWATVFLITLWKTVGLWRAARRHAGEQRAKGRTAFWAIVVQCVVVLTVLSTGKDFVLTGIPELRGNYALAFQGDPTVDDFTIRVMREGTELEISGGIKYGLDKALRAALEASPNVKVIHFDSTGGRIGEAIKVHQTIKDRKLDTYVADRCYSACTLAFAAGRERWLAQDEGELGFHSASFPGWSQRDAELANDQQRAIFIANGFEPGFVREALATPADSMLNPEPDKLLAAGAITGLAPRDKFAFSGLGSDVTLERFTAWMRQLSTMAATIEKRDPEVAARMYQDYYTRYVRGDTNADLLRALVADFTSQIAKYKPDMDDETALALGQLLIDEYIHIAQIDTTVCYEYASGVKSTLPPGMLSDALIKRERAIKQRIIASSNAAEPLPKEKLDAGWKAVAAALRAGPNAKYVELLKRKPEPPEYASYCGITIVYYQTILQQPAPLAAALMRDTVSKK